MAGALGLKLNGPKSYGILVEDAYMGDGRREAMAQDIRDALQLPSWLGRSWWRRFSPPSLCQCEQSLDVDVRARCSAKIQHSVDARLIALTRVFAPNPRETRPRRRRMRTSRGHNSPQLAHRRDCAVGPSIVEVTRGPPFLAAGFANVHLVARECRAVTDSLPRRARASFRSEHSFDVEKPEALDRARRSLDAVWIGDPLAEHLISAAKTKHASAAAHVRADVDVPTGGAQRFEIVDRRFRTRQ